MFDFVRTLFDTDGFPARWHCGSWSDVHGWTHILADSAIFLAYAAIPISIVYFVRQRRDVAFPPLYWLFGAFILSCGFGHLIEATIFWHPWYRLSAFVKVVTAIASWATVIALVRFLPRALDLPRIAELNEQLRLEAGERRKAEEEVRRLNADLKNKVAELQTLLDVAPVAIGIAHDKECKQISTNPAFARLLRLGPEQNASLGAPTEAPTHFRVWKDGRELGTHELPLQRAASENVALRDFEEDVVFEDGSRVTLLSSAVPLHDHAGAVRGAIGAFMDITARKHAQQERLEVERKMLETQKLESLGILAGGIAHDFNNLLTGILGGVSLVRSSASIVASEADHHLAQIERSALRAADLCRQMLAYSGRGRFVLEEINVSELLNEISVLLESSIPKKVKLNLELSPDLPSVRVDATQLRQIMMNLVINAAEAIGEKNGIIRCITGLERATREYLDDAINGATLPEGDYVFVEVSDTGCGMDAETMKRIFEPFFTTKFTGRGLGLAATLGIVRGHRGALRVYSEVGRGTVFKILLPASSKDAREARNHPVPTQSFRGAGAALVIDDEEMVRSVLSGMLTRLGFEVTPCEDGREGIATLAAAPSRYCVAVLDLTMPYLDGEQVFLELRKIQPDLKVILMSGFNEQEAVNRFTGKGLAGFIQKPFTFKSLAAKLEAVLDPPRS